MKSAPGIRQRFYLPYGPFWQATRDPLNFWMRGFQEYGDVFRWDFGGLPIQLLSHPAHTQIILQDRYKNYPHSLIYEYIKLVVGEGLLTSEGDPWRRDRRMIQPVFQPRRLENFAKIVTGFTGNMLERWQLQCGEDHYFDITLEMMRLALGIISQTMFSRDVSGSANELGQATTEALAYLNYRVNHLIAPPLWVPTPINRRFKRSLKTMNHHVQTMIEDRRKEINPPDDLLSLLLASRDEETGHQMSDEQIRDQIVTFIGAGHETTAMALSWTWGLLAQHPHIWTKLASEVDNVLQGRAPTFADLSDLHYTGMVFQEALRLFPPAPFLSRRSIEDDEIGGYHIPANSLILVSQWVTHRHPQFWEEPEQFDPERFTLEKIENRPKYAYFPFSGGPRKCIGDQFAMMEAKLIIAMVVQQFKLELQAGQLPQPIMLFTLRPRGGMPMKLVRRG